MQVKDNAHSVLRNTDQKKKITLVPSRKGRGLKEIGLRVKT